MKTNKGLIGLALTVALSQDGNAKSEDPTVYEPLTRAEMIEVLRDYDINKVSMPVMGLPPFGYTLLKGVTDYLAKDIGINQSLVDEEFNLTVLHEFRHAIHKRKGFSQDERIIRDFSCRDFKDIYDKPCPKDKELSGIIKREYLE